MKAEPASDEEPVNVARVLDEPPLPTLSSEAPGTSTVRSNTSTVVLTDSDEPTGESGSEMSENKSCLEKLLGDVYVVSETPGQTLKERVEKEMLSYRSELDAGLGVNPLKWWKLKEARFPLLSLLAKRYLCVPGTSVPSERVFSTAGDIVTAQRSQLSAGNVDMLIFLKKNLD